MKSFVDSNPPVDSNDTIKFYKVLYKVTILKFYIKFYVKFYKVLCKVLYTSYNWILLLRSY